MISDWISSLNECRFLERVPLLAISPTHASLVCVRLGTDFQPQRSWLRGERGLWVGNRTRFLVIAALVAVVVIAALAAFLVPRGDHAKLSETAATGPSPTLPEPTKTLIPTVHIAPAKGWRDGAKPAAANGLAVNALATGL